MKKGKIVQIIDEASDHDDNDSSESEFENDLENGDESDTEAYKVRAKTINSIFSRNTTTALYSASNSLELFYLCKVLDFGIADQNLVDDTVCSYHVTYAFESESTLYSCQNVKELLAQNRCEI